MTKFRGLWGICFLAALILAELNAPIWVAVIAFLIWFGLWFKINYDILREMMA